MMQMGDPAGAIPQIRGGLDLLKTVGIGSSYSYYLTYLAQACLDAGRLDEARALVREGLELCATRLASFHEAELLRIEGECLAREGDETAKSVLGHAVERARAIGSRGFELRAESSLASVRGMRQLEAVALAKD
jgi:hypothetical protein